MIYRAENLYIEELNQTKNHGDIITVDVGKAFSILTLYACDLKPRIIRYGELSVGCAWGGQGEIRHYNPHKVLDSYILNPNDNCRTDMGYYPKKRIKEFSLIHDEEYLVKYRIIKPKKWFSNEIYDLERIGLI
jgi:hypothetical protein